MSEKPEERKDAAKVRENLDFVPGFIDYVFALRLIVLHYYHADIHARCKHTVLTHTSAIWAVSISVSSFVVSEREEGIVTLHIGPLMSVREKRG